MEKEMATISVREKKKIGGLAIASFVLTMVGLFLCMTILGIALGIFCLLLGFIFGIIALFKKKSKWAAWIGTIVSGLVLFVFGFIGVKVGSFISQNSENLINPVKQLSTWIDQNPQIKELMDDEKFEEAFQNRFKEKMMEFNSGSIMESGNKEEVLKMWAKLFEMIPIIAQEIANEQGIILQNDIKAGEQTDIILDNEQDNEELYVLPDND